MCSKKFYKHCDDYDLLPENQSAYRKHYSYETSLLRMTNDILCNMENKLVTAVTLLDLSDAFDTVDLDILEVLHNKLEYMEMHLNGTTITSSPGNSKAT